jgi:hypothetical protein
MAPHRVTEPDPGTGGGAASPRSSGGCAAEGEWVPGRERGQSGPSSGLTSAGGEFVQLVVDYAKQETVEPIKNLGRFVAFGLLGSICLAIGTVFLLLAALRAIQSETGSTFTGNLSWLPYVITGAVALAVLGLAAWRITRGPGAKSSRGRSDRRPS